MYLNDRLAKYFQDPSQPSDSVLRVGSTGIACRNVRIALRYLGFAVEASDAYDQDILESIEKLQTREAHEHKDGLVGPGTRALLVRTLLHKGSRRLFNLMTFPKGEAFPEVFVSYAREDQLVAEAVVDALVSEGVKLWVDYRNLKPGEKWQLAIEKAIPAARYFLALISNNALTKKGYVQKEVKTAWTVAEQYPDSEVFVIPARIEQCEVNDPKFAQLHWIDLFPDATKGNDIIGKRLAYDPANKGVRELIEFLAQAV